MRSLIGFLVVVGVQSVAIGARHVSDETPPDDSTEIWTVISLLEGIEKKMENMETRMNHRQDEANKRLESGITNANRRLENGIINLKKKVDTIHTLMQNYIKGLTTAKPMTTKKGPQTGQCFILVTTGCKMEPLPALDPEKIYKDSMIISTDGRKCKSFPSFPMALYAATGGIVKGAPIVCGGELYPSSNQCFIHDLSRNEWRFLSNMTDNRSGASSVVLDGALWITGGGPDRRRMTTEFIYPSGKVVQGPDLPIKLDLPPRRPGHCMVKLHDGKIMILGLEYDDGKQVLIYDPKSNSFSKGPPLLYGMVCSSCTVFNSPMHNGRPVILVTGGYDPYEIGKPFSSQIFDYTYRDSWEIGPSLPKVTSKDRHFYDGGTLLPTSTGAIGFFQNVALRLDCSATKCEWKEMDVEMDFIPSFAVAMYLPEKYAQKYGC